MTPSKHAEERLVRLKICAQICIHINIHMYIHAYLYIYIYTCIYIHMYMSLHIHTCTNIHTHVQHVHMHACKHVWKDGTVATAREAWLDAKKLCPSPCPLQSGGGSPSVASSPIARPWGTTDKRRTTTTNSSSSHHHDSTPPRLQPLICTGAEPIHPVHGPPKLRATEATPRNEVMFLPFSRVLEDETRNEGSETTDFRIMVSQLISLFRISQRSGNIYINFVSQKRTHQLGIPARSIDIQQTSMSELLSTIIRGREQSD